MINIIHGDMLDVLRSLPDASVDCVATDPPYGETSLEWDRWPAGWPERLLRVLKPTGSMWVFGSLRMFFDHLPEFVGWQMSHEVIWEKQNGTGFFTDRFRRVHEMAVHFYPSASRWADIYKAPQMTLDARARVIRKKAKPAQWQGERGATVYRSEDGGPRLVRSVIFAPNEHGRALHPTQKPSVLVAPLLRYACPVGGVVLDPFAGSGTTGVVARECGMQAILIEKNAAFVDVIRQRLDDDAPLLRRAAE
ncbi:DNA-methyltransferase [Pleomorphomonas oryzae]|uniref:DNA-methyltransferase n=1 Tax=Pleomorphomonas oryzae TaxID=261934 RepID=UPI0004268F93|nr:site-specific DNA-methyltransferase [Pleomorphomonas oryzae]